MYLKSLEFSGPTKTVAIVLGDMHGMYPDQSAVLEAMAFMLSFGPVRRFDCLLDFDALAFTFSDIPTAMLVTVAIPKFDCLGRYRVIQFGYLAESSPNRLSLPPMHAASSSDISPTSRRSSIRALDDADFQGVSFTGQRSPVRLASTRGAAPVAPTVETLHDRQQLDIDPYAIGKDPRCTLMMRNLPKGLTQADFFEKFSAKLENVEEYIDFVYMPYDSPKQQNFGYVFLNARSLDKVGSVYRTFHGRGFFTDQTQPKSCQVAYARLQGRDKFIAQFNREAVLKLPKQLRPLILESSNGTETFTEIRSHAGSMTGSSVWRYSDVAELDDTGRIAEAVAQCVLPD